MSRERRARLPGADELFRSTSAPERTEPNESPATPEQRVLAELVEYAATDIEPRAQPNPTGTFLAWLAGVLSARHVVSVGDPALAPWLMGGMERTGILTSIALDEREHAAVRARLDAVGAGDRVRAILGSPFEILPRLSDGSYDLVVWSAPVDRPREVRDHALRLLRVNGVFALLGVVSGGRDRPALVRDLVEEPRCRVSVLPVGEGVALARHAG